MVSFNRLKDCVVSNKSVILRVDLNVPIHNNQIEDDTRLRAVIPTLKYLIKNHAKVIVISHFARPEGKFVDAMSLKQVVDRLQELLENVVVKFIDDCVGSKVQEAVSNTNYGEVLLLENLRFYQAETKNDQDFSLQLASLGNLYVNDAFSCSHRSHASITGIPKFLKSCAGLLMEKELDNLTTLLENPKKPMMAVVGGAKVSTKIDLLKALISKTQTIVVGGGMANTFLYALGNDIGKSLCEKDLKATALEIIEQAKLANCQIILPSDVIVAKQFKENATHRQVAVDEVSDDDIVVDIGQRTLESLSELVASHSTILWNGPLGAFELTPFNAGTVGLAKKIAELTMQGKIISIAGGGDVVSAINSCQMFDKFTYISTAGGAFLEWLEGKSLPGILALENSTLKN